MDCTESRSRLHAYLDQELDLPSVVAIDQHLASCAACKTIFTQQSALQVGIRKHAVYHEAPAGLAERIRVQIGGTRAKTPRWPWRGQPRQPCAALAPSAPVSWTAGTPYNRPPR